MPICKAFENTSKPTQKLLAIRPLHRSGKALCTSDLCNMGRSFLSPLLIEVNLQFHNLAVSNLLFSFPFFPSFSLYIYFSFSTHTQQFGA